MSDRQVFVGVDIGGTKIGLNAIGADRQPLSNRWIEVPAMSHLGPSHTVGQIVVGVREFLKSAGLEPDAVTGIGVDSPGPGDINGKIQKSANMHADWEGFELRQEAQKAVSADLKRNIHVTYENDCNAAALWESHVGNPEGTEVMALLAPGTGLGGGTVIQGRLLRGSRGMGGELGHIEIVHEPFVDGWVPACGCGQVYCAEAYTSMAALMKVLPIALKQPKWKDHPLNHIHGENDADTWRKRAYQVRGLAAGGDPLAQGIFDWQSRALGKLCRQIANTIDPDRIVIGGGFIEGGEQLTARIMQTIRDSFATCGFPKHVAEVRFEVAQAGDQAGCLGAALSAWQYAKRYGR